MFATMKLHQVPPPEIISLALGAMTWGGLYLRNSRIRAILPLIR